MNSDPIEDSPPKRKTYDSQDESGDDLFDEEAFRLADTIATQPVHHEFDPHAPRPLPSRTISAPQYVTQPTQLLTTTGTQMSNSTQIPNTPQRLSQILVPASSSPLQPPARISGIAPPGTQFRAPVLPRSLFTNAPQTQMTDAEYSDRLPSDSDSDDELARTRNDIPTLSVDSFKPHIAQYAYKPQSHPSLKRAGDDTISAYANASRPPKAPRQTGPARAMAAAQPQINDLTDIPDFEDKMKVQQMRNTFPTPSIAQLYSALRLKRGNVDDAMNYIIEELDKVEESKEPGPIDLTVSDTEDVGIYTGVAKMKAVRRDALPAKKAKTMAEKYSKLQQKPSQTLSQMVPTSPTAISPIPQKKFKRLMQGRRAPATPVAFSPSPSPQKPHVSEVIAIKSDSEDPGSYGEDEDNVITVEAVVLEALNTCTEQELAELAGGSTEDAALIITKRPFKSLNQVRKISKVNPLAANGKKRGGMKITLGERVVSKAIEIETSMEAVDRVVGQCDKYTRDIQKDMKDWGVSATTGEGLDLVSFKEPNKHDSGTGTPTSPANSEKSGKTTSGDKFVKQPANMSSDITMKDYQVVGLNWLNLLWSKQESWSKSVGCILAGT
jgi:SWI/SNF-related matrix-associated actin-dependent regulator 1 of chromatin subfamily A